MIHQAAKITDSDKKEEYLNWIYDFEYNIMGLPKPDYVIFLNMRFDLAQKLMEKRIIKSPIRLKRIFMKVTANI